MATLKFKKLTIEDAKDILKISYEKDKSATYRNDFQLHGSILTATIEKNEKVSEGYIRPRFDIMVIGSSLNETSLKEGYEDYLFAL